MSSCLCVSLLTEEEEEDNDRKAGRRNIKVATWSGTTTPTGPRNKSVNCWSVHFRRNLPSTLCAISLTPYGANMAPWPVTTAATSSTVSGSGAGAAGAADTTTDAALAWLLPMRVGGLELRSYSPRVRGNRSERT